MLQATWNYERQQGLGWAWCLKPVIDRLYPDAERRRQRLADHTAYFNTQPTLASLALGAVAGLEEQVADGGPADAASVSRVKGVLGSALAAVGDRLFWFTLRPLAACLGVACAVRGSWAGAVVLWLTYNVVHLTVRFYGVPWGYRLGPAVLGPDARKRFDRLVQVLATMGAAAVGATVAVILVPGGTPRSVTFQVTLLGGLTLGLLTALRPRPSPTEWALGVGALCIIAGWVR
jgi:PTS system mannose-specific IID component